MIFHKYILSSILLSCMIQLSKSNTEERIPDNKLNGRGNRVKYFKNKSNLRRKAQSSSSSLSVSSYTVTTTTYNNENPCPTGVNCNSPIVIIGPINEVPQPETEIIINTESPTPSPLNKFRKIFTEVSIIFGNQADIMTGEQIKLFEQSMLDYWAYYIDTDKMFMDEVNVNYQISLSATEYLATSRDPSVDAGGNASESNDGGSSDGGRRLYNYYDYDYYGLDREATGFNISTSLYVDPTCFGCPDPQTLQIDSINPVGSSLFGRALSDNVAVIPDPMHIQRVPQRGLKKNKDNLNVRVNYNEYIGASEQSTAEKESASEQSSSKTSYSTSSTSSQSTTTTTKTSTTTTTSSSTTKTSSSNGQNNIFAVFREESTSTTPEIEDVQIITTTTTTTTTAGASNTVTPADGLVYYLRSTMPLYFNQVDDAMAFSHPEVSLYDSLVCYINFSIVVQEVGKDYWFLTCEQYLYHQCSVIEEQCYPEGEVPCIGL